RTERRAQLRGVDRRLGTHHQRGHALEREAALADRGNVLLVRIDERDVVPGRDQVCAGDATDRAGADDGESHPRHLRRGRRLTVDTLLSSRAGWRGPGRGRARNRSAERATTAP